MRASLWSSPEPRVVECKTVTGPWWLHRQMQRLGPGDYIVAGPELTLLRKKVIPEFVNLFGVTLRAGSFTGSPDPKFVLSKNGERVIFGSEQRQRTTVWFGHGDDPDSLESMTAKAAWLDEAGQKKFRLASWEAIQRRLAIADGPTLITTTPYTIGWLKTEVHDREGAGTGIAVIGFDSLANPRFPRDVWDRAKAGLPMWKFDMFYRGRFTKPAGMIYDCWDDEENVVPTFAVPDDWPRYLGADFGGVNTAAVKVAGELAAEGKPTGRYVAYDEYLAGGRTAAQHADHWRRGEPRLPRAIGGSKSEGQWRKEFAAARFPIHGPPISDVEVGILRLYGLVKERNFLVMAHLRGVRDQFATYSRVLDAQGEPTEEIEDKETFHYLDGLRYFAAYVGPKKVARIW